MIDRRKGWTDLPVHQDRHRVVAGRCGIPLSDHTPALGGMLHLYAEGP